MIEWTSALWILGWVWEVKNYIHSLSLLFCIILSERGISLDFIELLDTCPSIFTRKKVSQLYIYKKCYLYQIIQLSRPLRILMYTFYFVTYKTRNDSKCVYNILISAYTSYLPNFSFFIYSKNSVLEQKISN